jgi:hypothetical protein
MNKRRDAKFKADNYGDVLAAVHGLELVSFEQTGDYHGKYLAVLKDTNRLFYYIGAYGSCSVCDWLEEQRDWDTNEISLKAALDYCADIKPKYIVPLNKPLEFEKTDDEMWEIVI